jgi:hypothetical protein|tara:strand:- start:546 stop:713 length:168 start_codon:yes stop_codon:yes gene_type:complete
VAKIMGSSECEICKENDYLDEYILGDEVHPYESCLMVCRNCVEEGLKLRIKKLLG